MKQRGFEVTRHIASSSRPLAYTYDPAGNRIALSNATGVTRFVVNPNAALSQVLIRIRPGVTNYYVYGLGLLYQVTETATSTNTLTYHYDYRGSTVALTDGTGNVTDRFEYSAYGTLTYRTGSTDTPFLFNGRYGVQTDLNGLLFMRARYYNPYICRFVSSDPIGFAGGLNFYAYADGNPVSLIDPFGLCAMGESMGGWLSTTWTVVQGVGLTVGGFVPWVGDLLDAYTLVAPGSSTLDRSLSGGSLAVNAWTAGMAPNLGPVKRGIGMIAEALGGGARNVANPVPSTLARVVDARFVNSPTLGAPGAGEVFVTAASDIRGINNAQDLASRLTLLDNAGNLRQGPFAIIEFNTPASGIASPVFRNNPGFVQGGLTAGGAREFVLPNMAVDQLQNVSIRIVP